MIREVYRNKCNSNGTECRHIWVKENWGYWIRLGRRRGRLNGMAKGISKRDIKGVTKKNGWGGVGGGYPKGSRGGGGV